MEKNNNEKTDKCHPTLEYLSSVIVFVLVIGVIFSSLYFMLFDISRSKEVSRITIQVEAADSLNIQQTYSAEGIDSLLAEVKRYEDRLGEKYQYLIEQKEDDDRFKTWGALVVGVIVSVCSFWGYRSLKDLRSDVKKQTEVDTITIVNEFMNKKLDGLVRELLTNALRGEVTDTIKTHVIETLNSDEEMTISTRVKAVMESDKFDKHLNELIKEKVNEVVEDMVLSRQRELHGVRDVASREEETLTM